MNELLKQALLEAVSGSADDEHHYGPETSFPPGATADLAEYMRKADEFKERNEELDERARMLVREKLQLRRDVRKAQDALQAALVKLVPELAYKCNQIDVANRIYRVCDDPAHANPEHAPPKAHEGWVEELAKGGTLQ